MIKLQLDVLEKRPNWILSYLDNVDVCQLRSGIRGGQSGRVPFAVFKSRCRIWINYPLDILSGSGIKVAVSAGLQLAETGGELRNVCPGTANSGRLRTNPQRGGEQQFGTGRKTLSSASLSQCYHPLLWLQCHDSMCQPPSTQLCVVLKKSAGTPQPGRPWGKGLIIEIYEFMTRSGRWTLRLLPPVVQRDRLNIFDHPQAYTGRIAAFLMRGPSPPHVGLIPPSPGETTIGTTETEPVLPYT